jgi:carbon monoxide dehydrogenase subunit G
MMRVHACLLASAAAACASLPGVSSAQAARDEFAWSIPIEVPPVRPWHVSTCRWWCIATAFRQC